jgi:hypothetical protein
VVPPQKPIGGVEPHVTSSVLTDGHKARFVCAPANFHSVQVSIFYPENVTSIRADPKIPVAVFEKVYDRAAIQLGSITFIKSGKPQPIEASQAVERSDPKIPIASLGHCDNGVLGQSRI